ncbi:5' exonuclease Apollo-like [Actinia tenebrosa]|uniref:5' exonuclease Apollo n=1 Tax=Actinia tenebrosa TaxID=6105 RepID=A0A6P8JAD2_ACTTE|nr:5' exonuclease Apollo-like [Actinia tenebrosa]
MNGAIIPHTPNAVDFWNARETAAKNCRLFFLTHAHADHTVGLSSSWKNHKIYCSELTKRIILHKFGICKELVVGLPVDQPIVIAMDEVGKENLTVTLIDANHCPGAVLFLFQGYFGNILYTGDFRYHSMFNTHYALQHTVIDKLYLDNTYCDPKCVFPTREEATNMILDVVRKHLDFNIVFGMNTLGKEDLMAKIGLTFHKWIGVDPKRMELLKLLDLPDVFTCDIDSTSIRIVMKNEISKRNLQLWNNQHPTIAILPTALFEGETNIYQNMDNVFVIPFSDHSSFNELMTFVSEIKPKEIVPLVLRHRGAKGDPDNTRVNMAVFSSMLNKEPLGTFTIPETVLQFMGMRTTVNKVKKRTKSFGNPRRKKQKCSGVVFSDEEEEKAEISLHNPELKMPENKTYVDRKLSSSLEPVNPAINTGFTSISGSTDEVNAREKILLQDSCALENTNLKLCKPDMDLNTKGSTLEQVDIDVELTGTLKRKEDIKIELEDPPDLQNLCVMEEMNTQTCTCKREKELVPRMCNVLKQEEDIKTDDQRMNFLHDKQEKENEAKLLHYQTNKNSTVNKSSLTSKEAESTTNNSTEDLKLARKLLDAFNSGQYEDECTLVNPVYKRFESHFCEYLRTLTSKTTLEAKKDAKSKYPLPSSPRMKWDTKSEGSFASHLKMNFVLGDENDDSEEESAAGFNWFSS